MVDDDDEEEMCIHGRFFFRVHCYIEVAGRLGACRMSHVYPVFLQRCNTIAILCLVLIPTPKVPSRTPSPLSQRAVATRTQFKLPNRASRLRRETMHHRKASAGRPVEKAQVHKFNRPIRADGLGGR